MDSNCFQYVTFAAQFSWLNYLCIWVSLLLHVMTKFLSSLHIPCLLNTWHFVMFSTITNIYNKKTKGPALTELFTATGKLKKFFWQLEVINVCTMGDVALIDTIFKCLPHASTWVHWYSSLLQWSMPKDTHVIPMLNSVFLLSVSPLVLYLELLLWNTIFLFIMCQFHLILLCYFAMWSLSVNSESCDGM
jgi:hypothetical protein